MNSIKFLKQDKIKLAGQVYRPYTISDLPNNFGCLMYGEQQGINEWFAFKGFTYIHDK